VFLHPDTHEEYALARTERKTGSGYTGFSVYAAPDVTLEDDLQRRDLTINAMAVDAKGRLFDPFNGKKDLQNKILRHVSPAFAEDPVRILRIARFAARFNFNIAEETLVLMKNMVANGEVNALVAERVWQETVRALTTKNPPIFFTTLDSCGALSRIFPELNSIIETNSSSAMSHLQLARHKTNDSQILFAVLVCNLNQQIPEKNLALIKTLCKRCRVPSQYRELAILMARYHKICQDIPDLSAQIIHDTLQGLDAFRRPQRFEQFLLACKVYYGKYADKFYHLYEITNQIEVANVIADGFQGKEISEELRKRRINIIANLP
ncbi:MAG: multifunctional CCA tRNA nucleotidyl transferase/2'3'-cyclic phosphodiesterase/2'nucleotidase/phosphatase, partial [Candidatus Marithrix sp.]|nr:multifunctional CCA tRNA nucleotidyl transferase/2'3'-cyclic phosphodiesterase/2'nucleotidase/phosphatase [Candidatus Marithrix sp.]